ncbi:fumarylacetoacetate hydrolase family protein [Virgibacillus siamensis]|uniref:fumarylacetoacetate hydrolase family protein n=1 Tax=Virgibacillus siamensis TaxID=480071 RepID=UPI00098765E9|nr:fumarylacetoacetate hydrolase family protein [Virgibacillus siamensis]
MNKRLTDIGSVYGVLFNFQGELEKMESALHEKPYKEPPKRPVLYIKPKNTHNHHYGRVEMPEGVSVLQAGPALGIIFERTAVNVPSDRAMDYVAGFTVVNDISVPHDNFFRPDIKNKVRDGTCPMGSVMEKASIHDADMLPIRVYVNDKLVQENNTANLVRPVAQLISDISQFMTFSKGDILLAGVPENAPLIGEGDTVRIDIETVGVLENRIVPLKEGDCK